jgi:hypothetical protein
MPTAKAFRPEFKTRDGRKVSFGANYTHDTKAKRAAGLTKAGRPKVEAVGAGTVVRRPRRWLPWAVFGVNSAVLGGTWAVAELGPAGGGLVVGGTLWAGYRVARWTAGEWAYFATKSRQIKGGQQAGTVAEFASESLPPQARVPGDTVSRP